MAYTDYTFYKDTFGGSMPESIFNSFLNRASAYIDLITFNRLKGKSNISEEIKMATCAVIEEDYKLFQSDGKVKSNETIGNYSVSYSINNNSTPDKVKYNAAKMYLANTGLLYAGGGCYDN